MNYLFLIPAWGLGMLWRGWVFSQLWGWFMVPLLGLPALGTWAAMGVSLMLAFAATQRCYQRDKDPTDWAWVCTGWALTPAAALLIGWGIKQGL